MQTNIANSISPEVLVRKFCLFVMNLLMQIINILGVVGEVIMVMKAEATEDVITQHRLEEASAGEQAEAILGASGGRR